MRAVEKVYLALRDGIAGGTFAPGERLGEVELAERLGVSRTPVREALRRLESEGLIETLPNRGARVRSWTMYEITEVYELRALLESRAAGRAARFRTEDESAQLYELCAEMENAASQEPLPDLELVAAKNAEFHALVLASARSPLLAEMSSSVTMVSLMAKAFSVFGRERLAQSMYQHRELADAITAHNQTWAEAVMRAHVLSATHFMANVLPLRDLDTHESAEFPSEG